MSIGLNITGCSNGESGNDNENKNKNYAEVALEALEERYGEPFELKQVGGTFGANRNTKKLICNPVSNPNTYCFVEVESDKTEVHDDYANRIMEERYAGMLEEEAKKIFDEELNVKVSFNPFYDRYPYLDMELLEFYKDNVHSHYSIHLFINSSENINKESETIKVNEFANKIIDIGLNKTSGITAWYVDEETFNEVNSKYYEIQLGGTVSKYYIENEKFYDYVSVLIKDGVIVEKF